MSSPKENRGGFARAIGLGRGGAGGKDAPGRTGAGTAVSGEEGKAARDPAGGEQASNGKPTHPSNGRGNGNGSGHGSANGAAGTGVVKVAGSAKPDSKAEVVQAPDVSDAVDRQAARRGGPGVPKAAAPAKGTVDQPQLLPPSQAVAQPPSQARAQAPAATQPGPGASAGTDAPIPKSKLGRARTAEPGRPTRVRRARLKIANVDPWSVMKVSFLFSVALGVIMLVAVALLWLLLDFMGFFSTVAGTVDDITGDESSTGFDVVGFFSLPRVLGMTTILALIEIVMVTALTTLAAYLYNLSTDLVGGVEVTLAEEE